MNSSNGYEKIPIGLAMALAQNMNAMEKFAGLSEGQQSAVIRGATSVHSKNEMRQIVQSLAEGTLPPAF